MIHWIPSNDHFEHGILSFHDPITIIDLGFYRGGSEHSCEGDVGYPPGMLVVEGTNRNASMYHEIANIAYVRHMRIWNSRQMSC
jgi:hypothetical protein